jgi:hypothetical protein
VQLKLLGEEWRRRLAPLENGRAAEGAGRLPPCSWAAFAISTDRP